MNYNNLEIQLRIITLHFMFYTIQNGISSSKSSKPEPVVAALGAD
jgi:hypothetical protein